MRENLNMNHIQDDISFNISEHMTCDVGSSQRPYYMVMVSDDQNHRLMTCCKFETKEQVGLFIELSKYKLQCPYFNARIREYNETYKCKWYGYIESYVLSGRCEKDGLDTYIALKVLEGEE